MDAATDVSIDLPTHEAHSEARAEKVISAVKEMKGKIMSHEPEVSVKNIFEPGHGGGDSAGGGNIWAAVLPALMAERGGRGHDGLGGLGSGFVGGVLGGLLFNRRGGAFGDGEVSGGGVGPAQAASDFITLQTLGNIQRDIATSANETQAVVNAVGNNVTQGTLQQTIALNNSLGSLALGTQQGFAATKDAVQNTAAILGTAICNLNQNVSAQGCQTREAVSNDGDKTRAMLFARFQLEDSTRINELNARVIELQSEHRRHADAADLRLQITNTNTAVAAQAQGQQQQQQQFMVNQVAALVPLVHSLINESQVARATNANLIFGNTGATTTGAQTNTPTNVRA